MTRFLTIISGSSNVGKTALSLNLADRLRAKGRKPILLTEKARWISGSSVSSESEPCELKEIIEKQEGLDAHMITGPAQIDLLNLRLPCTPEKTVDPARIDALCNKISELEKYDTFLLDMPGGFTQAALSCCMASSDCLLVATPEPRVLNQTLRLLKILSSNGFRAPLKLVVTRADGREAAEETCALIKEISTSDGIDIPLEYVGSADQAVLLKLESGLPRSILAADKQDKAVFDAIAEKILGSGDHFPGEMKPASFWVQLIKRLSLPLSAPIIEKTKELHKPEISLNNGELLSVLKNIGDHLGNISKELAQIRSQLATGESATAQKASSGTLPSSLPEIIRLDLDTYAAKNKPLKPEK